ncbi:MAG: hypothetical protein KC613_15230 [Myxococcales bacterium]|nr:hypothetical protein [Myxococcales bacterium]MCB9526013.1 hypothetical protein [Myxococcales bacterium]
MGRIILTIAGPWHKAPDLPAGPLDVEFGPAEPALAEEMADLAAQNATFEAPELKALRNHKGVLFVSADVPAEGDLSVARAAADFMRAAFAAGALGAYVETAVKVFSPSTAAHLAANDATTLFHLFVEIYGEPGRALTEGMQAFGMRDVEVPFRGPDEAAPAQAAAFALAARMVCDGVRPSAGHPFRASESAPLFRVAEAPVEPLPEDPEEAVFVNPRGRWRLTRA